MIIYDKQTLRCVGKIQNNTNFEWEIEHNVIPNFGGAIEDYSVIETDLIRFHLENINGEIVAVEDGLSIEVQKNKIKSELNDLDKLIPRVLEDIIEQSGYTLHPSKLAVLEQKKELRKQLNELS